MPIVTHWSKDPLLTDFQAVTIELPDAPTYAGEPEGSLCATLVRRNPPERGRAVLYIHGWNDYFFQTQLADEMASLGYDFYALDLRRYGRSLRPGQLAGFVSDLAAYDAFCQACLLHDANVRGYNTQIVLEASQRSAPLAF